MGKEKSHYKIDKDLFYKIKGFLFGFAFFSVFAFAMVYAWGAVWHGTNWNQSGKVVTVKDIAENLEYLKQEIDNLQSSGGGGGYSNVQVYTTPGSYNFTVPNGVTRLFVEVYGAGGGGAGYSGLQKDGEASYFAKSTNIEISAGGGYKGFNKIGGNGGIGIKGDIIQRGGDGQNGASLRNNLGQLVGLSGSGGYNMRGTGGRGGLADRSGGVFGGGGGGDVGYYGGGGAGGVASGFVSVTPGMVIPIIVGKGGNGGDSSNNAGGDGGVIIWW